MPPFTIQKILYMKLKSFETKIKKLDKDLELINLSDRDIYDIVAIRYKDYFTVGSVPSKDIYREKKTEYTDIHGTPHRTVGEALSLCRAFLDKYKNNEEFKQKVDELIQERITNKNKKDENPNDK